MLKMKISGVMSFGAGGLVVGSLGYGCFRK